MGNRGGVALLAAWLGTAAVARPAGKSAESGYAGLVERYADGDGPAASKALAALEAREVRDGARALAGGVARAWDDRARAVAKAAGLLHLDTARLSVDGDTAGIDRHLGHALLFVAVADEVPADADLRSFARRFYLAAALYRQRFLEMEDAGVLLDQGLRRCPKDAELHLARGLVEETLATWPVPAPDEEGAAPHPDRAGGLPVGRLAAVEPKDRLARAEGAFRAALQADPGLVEGPHAPDDACPLQLTARLAALVPRMHQGEPRRNQGFSDPSTCR
jgi:hypothetical protein